jgi:hypothetical protein
MEERDGGETKSIEKRIDIIKGQQPRPSVPDVMYVVKSNESMAEGTTDY